MFKTIGLTTGLTTRTFITSIVADLVHSLITRNRNHKKLVLLSCLSMLAVVGCGQTDDIDRDSPDITITSHTFGEEITINQNITLAGTISSDVSLLTIQLNDTAAVEAKPSGQDFSMDLALALGKNTIAVKARDATGNSRTATLTLYFPFLQLTNDQAASVVIGQDDFGVNEPNRGNGTPDASTLSQVMGTPAKTSGGTLYLPDTGNNRILGYGAVPTDNNASASTIVGQVDFTTSVAGTTSTSLNGPNGFVIADNQYFAVDTGNNRVLVWNAFPNNTGVEAAMVLGQVDFTSAAPGCGTDKLSSPSSIIVMDEKIIVSDSGNNRVLIWNTIPKAPTDSEFDPEDITPDVVIGQQNLDFCAPNDINGLGNTAAAPAASTLNGVGGIWSDGVRLVVADTNNHRVLVWNSLPVVHGQAADTVLGQADMITAAPATGQNGLTGPKSVDSNGNQIFVADSGNERVMIWDAFPATNQENANRVIGQVDFDTKDATQTSDTRMSGYDSIFADRDHLLVVDGNRVLLFQEAETP